MAARISTDQGAGFFASAIADIREKLVEEGWFGRPTAPPEDTRSAIAPAEQIQATAQPLTSMNWDARCARSAEHAHEVDQRDIELGHDR